MLCTGYNKLYKQNGTPYPPFYACVFGIMQCEKYIERAKDEYFYIFFPSEGLFYKCDAALKEFLVQKLLHLPWVNGWQRNVLNGKARNMAAGAVTVLIDGKCEERYLGRTGAGTAGRQASDLQVLLLSSFSG